MARKKKQQDRHRIYFVVGVVAFLLLAIVIYKNRVPAPSSDGVVDTVPNDTSIHATFVCPDSTSIKVTFFDEGAYVVLPDGRSYEMHATPSAGGVRYENGDGSIVLWNTGNSARVDEGDATLYSDCVSNT